MELENVCDRTKWLESESFPDWRFWTTRDEELDPRNLMHVSREHGKKGGCGLPVLTLVEGINDDQGEDLGFFERTNDELFELGTERLSSNIRVDFQDLKQLFSELWVPAGELERERREDGLEVALVFEVS